MASRTFISTVAPTSTGFGDGTLAARVQGADPLLGQVAAEEEDADQDVHREREQPGLKDQGGEQDDGEEDEEAAHVMVPPSLRDGG